MMGGIKLVGTSKENNRGKNHFMLGVVVGFRGQKIYLAGGETPGGPEG